MNHMFC